MGDLGFAVRNPVNKVVMNIFVYPLYGGCSSIGGASDCDSEGCGFKPHQSPHRQESGFLHRWRPLAKSVVRQN